MRDRPASGRPQRRGMSLSRAMEGREEGMGADHELGRRGEDLAAAHLERNGYLILARNVRLRRGEIDIVAREGGDLVFVEVKTRAGDFCGTPEEAVTAAKLRHLARAAQEYLYSHLLTDQQARCDVVSVDLRETGEEPRIRVYRDAVELGELLPR